MLRLTTRVVVGLLVVVMFSSVAHAAPVTLTLVRTTPLFNQDPPGAPLPLARTQHDGGNIMSGNRKIGEFHMVKDVHAAGLNVAAVTITLFFPVAGSDVPVPITLQGAHTFDTGHQIGSVSACPLPGIVGAPYDLTPTGVIGQSTLTIVLP